MCTLKPLDEEAIVAAAAATGAIVTAENCSDIGGLGDGVAAVLAENLPTPMVKVGVEDEFSQSGLITVERDELMEHFGLGARDLAVAVKQCIGKKRAIARV
jgi:transketolase